MKKYIGILLENGSALVSIIEDGIRPHPLPPRFDLDNHSPTGFAWGYGGSGPAQLALALLADALGDDKRALRLHQQFKWRVVLHLPTSTQWTLSAEQIRATSDDLDAAHNRGAHHG